MAISSPINELFSRADEDVLSCSVYQTAINRVSWWYQLGSHNHSSTATDDLFEYSFAEIQCFTQTNWAK